MEKSNYFYIKNDTTWEKMKNDITLERVYVDSITQYLKAKL